MHYKSVVCPYIVKDYLDGFFSLPHRHLDWDQASINRCILGWWKLYIYICFEGIKNVFKMTIFFSELYILLLCLSVPSTEAILFKFSTFNFFMPQWTNAIFVCKLTFSYITK